MRDFLEEADRKDPWQCVERGSELEPFLDNGHEHVNRDRDPDLGLHGVLRSAMEALDA
jgi:hypothetical protein